MDFGVVLCTGVLFLQPDAKMCLRICKQDVLTHDCFAHYRRWRFYTDSHVDMPLIGCHISSMSSNNEDIGCSLSLHFYLY